ncbi:MAG: nicotinate-nucleotide--dimethylbenzimidazole phosphoribosyltransferase [Candidatus Dadabacteria bacterium]|nr:MAG: nicotinate-nucleotide--dimethylbenzimidazole phosphoribosyltransferase [Candidatus Dadabacteria bacterium]
MPWEPVQEMADKINPIDEALGASIQARLDDKTKPRGSLGRLEDIARRYALARGQELPPVPDAAVVVCAADHGVAAAGVSAYPQEVTAQMVANFARGGAAINVLCRDAGIRLVVADLGVASPIAGLDGVLDRRVGPGTADMREGPAMTVQACETAIRHGAAIAHQLIADGIGLIGLGEMGIGNTTAASALTAALLGLEADVAIGRGTGVDDAGLARKQQAVSTALERHAVASVHPLELLRRVGGFEIAALTGVTLAAAAARVPVVVDGFITAAAALVATRIAPSVRDYIFAAHCSVEPGHRLILDEWGLEPLLDFGMRLGEGSGAALAIPIIRSAARILAEMASFSDAGVTDTGR